MDPYGPQHVYAPYGHILSLFSMFFPFLFLPKRHYHPLHHQQSYDTAHLTHRLVFLLVVLALTVEPTFYIASVNNPSGNQKYPTAHKFFISFCATLLFAALPGGRLLGDRVAQVPRQPEFHCRISRLDRKARTESFYGLSSLDASSLNHTSSWLDPSVTLSRSWSVWKCKDAVINTSETHFAGIILRPRLRSCRWWTWCSSSSTRSCGMSSGVRCLVLGVPSPWVCLFGPPGRTYTLAS